MSRGFGGDGFEGEMNVQTLFGARWILVIPGRYTYYNNGTMQPRTGSVLTCGITSGALSESAYLGNGNDQDCSIEV